jgi:hypothetical protein
LSTSSTSRTSFTSDTRPAAARSPGISGGTAPSEWRKRYSWTR